MLKNIPAKDTIMKLWISQKKVDNKVNNRICWVFSLHIDNVPNPIPKKDKILTGPSQVIIPVIKNKIKKINNQILPLKALCFVLFKKTKFLATAIIWSADAVNAFKK
jgi:hypothetical protein